ncbi:addiction module antitoxin [Skermanella stibiiresistens SB22]|uniref:Addiction module antitoxin n=2 Tax=Skermanella TaxID=204447 RepID=W9GSJ9_9PROT|nr:addiction module antitoxin [Skermanella stibiiresistens SB22]
MTMPRSFALGGHFENFIDEQLRSGRYNNASEVVRDGLRMLEDRENLRQLQIAEIRQSIEASRKDGRTTPADEVLSRLEAKYTAMSDQAETQGDE